MEKANFTIPIHNLLANLIPGVVLAALLKFSLGFDLCAFSDSSLISLMFLYFLGLLNSRIGSLVLAPLLKKTGFVTYLPHGQFVEAELKDSSGTLTAISRRNVEFRNYFSAFISVLLLKILFVVSFIEEFITSNWRWLILLLGATLFLFSYKKQISFINSRISKLNQS